MQISIPDSFKCYISDCNEGKEFIEKYVLRGVEPWGLEMQLDKGKDYFKVIMIPLPEAYGRSPINFYEDALRLLSSKKLKVSVEDYKPWVHTTSYECEYRSVAAVGNWLHAYVMMFKLDPDFTEEEAIRYKKLMGVE